MRLRPPGNDAAGNVGPSFDVYAATRPINGGSWSSDVRLTDVTSNGQWEQFGGRTVPFGGDYLWIDSKQGTTFGTWTDWRNTLPGTDLRETEQDETGADVLQCRSRHRRWRDLRRHVSARWRPRPGHLRRPRAVKTRTRSHRRRA